MTRLAHRAASRLAVTALVVAATAGMASPIARAQNAPPRSGVVRGEVRASTGERVPYAIVSIVPAGRQRFADDSGAFRIGGIAPGPHRVLVRQIGFSPYDTTVTVPPEGDVVLAPHLRRITVQLSEITVSARGTCERPGPPDPALHPQLAIVFGQLRENAERYLLLADSYPAEYRMERTLGDLDAAGEIRAPHRDTVALRTDARWHYVPGRVITEESNGQRLLLPTLPDLADSAFQAAHCWYLPGLDTATAGGLLRVDFAPPVRLRAPDVEGSAWLDPSTYQVRRATVRLTNPSRADWRVGGLTVEMNFREIVPSIVLLDRISAVTRTLPVLGQQVHAEEQRLLAVRFLRPLSARE
jgi:hypothetical protein